METRPGQSSHTQPSCRGLFEQPAQFHGHALLGWLAPRIHVVGVALYTKSSYISQMDNETELNLNTPFGQIQMKAINPWI
jgi:hypothetical protein